TYGHAAGDTVLTEVAGRCRESLRSLDLVGRYGGDELVILLPESDLDAALTAAHRIRASLDAAPVETEHGPIRATISIGVASSEGCGDLAAVLHRADVALYE